MSEEKTSNPISAIIKPIGDIVTTATVVAAYIQGIFKVADTKIPNTVSLLLVVVTSIFVIGRRWGKLSEKRKKRPNNGNSKEKPKGSLREQILEPFKESKNDPYILPAPRRRLEAGFIMALAVFTVGWTGFNASAVVYELTTDPSLSSCSYAEGDANLLILVADVKETGEQQLFVSSKVYNKLVDNQNGSGYSVCRVSDVFEAGTDAVQKAKELEAAIIIWGTRDAVSYEIHLEAPAFEDVDKDLSDEAVKVAVSREFQVREVTHIAYVTEFTLSEIKLLQGRVPEAQIQLQDALDRARAEKNPPSQQDLADGYYLLGLLYDPNNSGFSDEGKAIDAYGEAEAIDEKQYAARLNRGILLGNVQRIDEALEEFDYLTGNADTPTSLKGDALINRTLLLKDPQERISGFEAAAKIAPADGYTFLGGEYLEQKKYAEAIKNLEEAIHYDPAFFLNYHLLGLSQLYAGEYDGAKDTYKLIVPYLTEEDRQAVIQELKEKADAQPEIKPTVDEIIQQLQDAKLP